jgi:hypothetical protein
MKIYDECGSHQDFSASLMTTAAMLIMTQSRSLIRAVTLLQGMLMMTMLNPARH